MERKKQIRKEVLHLRNQLSEIECIEKSTCIMEKIREQKCYKDAKEILTYVDYKNEVRTRELIQYALLDGKQVYCPLVDTKTDSSKMDFLEIKSLNDLKNGYRGILEPSGDKKWIPDSDGKKSLMIVPGVGFDKERNRIGYGGGYYDTFLNIFHNRLDTIAICYSCQIVEKVPTEGHDRKPDILITENNMYL